MNFNEYQELAKSTAIYPEQVKGIYPILGLIGETGETVEKVIDIVYYTDKEIDDEVFNIISEIVFDSIKLGVKAEKLKKSIRDEGLLLKANLLDDENTKEEIKKELGDILWYLSAIASDIGISLDDVAQLNYNKLKSRQERGVLQGSGDNR